MLHLLIWWLFTNHFDELKFLPPHKQEKKITLNLKQMITPPPAPKPKPMPKPVVTPPLVSPVVEKPVVKKQVKPLAEVEKKKRKVLDTRKKTFANKSKEDNNLTKEPKKVVKNEKKHKPKKRKAHKIAKKRHLIQKRVVKRHTKHFKDPLANMLMGSGTSLNPKPLSQSKHTASYGRKRIKKLYGSEFNTFSPAQKNYIRHNLNLIHQITQRTLVRNGYPDVAIQTQQQGTNVVAFYLHPNGDITGLRLKKRIGYAALDENTLRVIKIAYKEYPLPQQTTKIIFYVSYSIY